MKSKLPQCVACLFRIGWGIKRVTRYTGYAKTTVARFKALEALGLAKPKARKPYPSP